MEKRKILCSNPRRHRWYICVHVCVCVRVSLMVIDVALIKKIWKSKREIESKINIQWVQAPLPSSWKGACMVKENDVDVVIDIELVPWYSDTPRCIHQTTIDAQTAKGSARKLSDPGRIFDDKGRADRESGQVLRRMHQQFVSFSFRCRWVPLTWAWVPPAIIAVKLCYKYQRCIQFSNEILSIKIDGGWVLCITYVLDRKTHRPHQTINLLQHEGRLVYPFLPFPPIN